MRNHNHRHILTYSCDQSNLNHCKRKTKSDWIDHGCCKIWLLFALHKSWL